MPIFPKDSREVPFQSHYTVACLVGPVIIELYGKSAKNFGDLQVFIKFDHKKR